MHSSGASGPLPLDGNTHRLFVGERALEVSRRLGGRRSTGLDQRGLQVGSIVAGNLEKDLDRRGQTLEIAVICRASASARR